MTKITKNSHAVIGFSLAWKSKEASHTEKFLGPQVSMWRDLFPAGIEKDLIGRAAGDSLTFSFEAGEIVPPYSDDKVLTLPLKKVLEEFEARNMRPRPGRFYPCGSLCRAASLFPQNIEPFRVVNFSDHALTADRNHPLAKYPLRLTLKIIDTDDPEKERGGRLNDWMEELTQNGPGMQARLNGTSTDFHEDLAFSRQEEGDDRSFYAMPRIINHVDSLASSFIRDEYEKHLKAGSKVLDLMSSAHSHLPQDRNIHTIGLGLNEQEMEANPSLDDFVMHDLNKDALLPFRDNEFHAAVCSLSIEYLTNPAAVINEVARVLKPGGSLLLSFSNRWFPPKVTRLWTQLHEFERLGFVLGLLLDSGHFDGLETLSIRNWPRPADDRHYHLTTISDPVYLVRGTRNP